MGNLFYTDPSTPLGNGMSISDARAFLLGSIRNPGNSSQYTNTILDTQLQAVCNDFIMRTNGGATRTVGDLSLAAASATLPSLSGLVGFRPEYIRRAYITDAPAFPQNGGEPPTLHLTGFDEVSDLLTNGGAVGLPRLLAFESLTAGVVYPTPDAAYTLRLAWTPPFTNWTIGTADGPTLATELNIPMEYLQGVLRWGGVYFLQSGEPENQKVMAVYWQNYLNFVETTKSRGVGTLGKQVSYRSDPRGRIRGRSIINGVLR